MKFSVSPFLFAALLLVFCGELSAADGQDLYLVCPEIGLRAFDATTGNALLGFSNTAPYSAQGVAVSGSNVYVANYSSGNMEDFDALSGQPISGFNAPNLPYTLQVAASNDELFLYQASGGPSIQAFSSITGESVSGFTPVASGGPIAASDGYLYVGNEAFNAQTGVRISNFTFGSGGPMTIYGSYFYTMAVTSGLVSVYNDKIGGQPLGMVALKGGDFYYGGNGGDISSIAVWGSDIYVAGVSEVTGNGVIDEYDLNTGNPVAGFTSPSTVTTLSSIAVASQVGVPPATV
jgi:hypothetical protein